MLLKLLNSLRFQWSKFLGGHSISIWKSFLANGWLKFDYDHKIYHWVNVAKKKVFNRYNSGDFGWNNFRCGNTWFVGVNFLGNDKTASLNGACFEGIPVTEIKSYFGHNIKYWDEAQVSICWPNYPLQSDNETHNAFNFRVNRYAAHVDGILPFGREKRRFLKDPHAFIFGIPITYCDYKTAPVVVWEGSHLIMREAFKRTYNASDSKNWDKIDVTNVYQKARSRVFETCQMKRLYVNLGESYLIDRLAVHGIAPWEPREPKKNGVSTKDIKNQPEIKNGRAVIYFRPSFDITSDWIKSYP